MKLLRPSVLMFAFFCSTAIFVASEDRPPITPEDLKMTVEPLAPGASAIILYRQVDRDDNSTTGHENNFVRIKILKEEGRKYADVEIPYEKGSFDKITGISGRTIHPDGSVSEFKGKPFDKQIVKAKGLKHMAKTFTLPDVQVGCVIEYSYTIDLAEHYVFDSHWILSEELFTKRARFTLKPYSHYDSMLHPRWSWHLLPPGTEPPKQGPDSYVRMETVNVPAFQTEDYMPPENELKSRVDFTYTDDLETDPVKFWKSYGKKLNSRVESFSGKRKAMEQAVAEIISPNDAPELKLQKIYERVQKVRNRSYEQRKTEQEQKREKLKDNSNVEDVWKNGFGWGTDLNWLFLALARAAGFEAYAVYASDRYNYFFDPIITDTHKLDSDLVLVKVNGKDVFCDPGAAFTPFGLLMWPETAVKGLRLDKDGGTWIQTLVPESSASRTIRKAELTLSETGDLEGKLTVTFTGLSAMQLRREELHEDEADKKKTLEDEAKNYVSAASELELTNTPDWTSSSAPLVVEFKLKIDGWASAAGRKVMLPVGLFSADEKRVFEHADRVHQVYFEYPHEKDDDISITLPAGWKVASLPKETVQDGHVIVYSLKAEDKKSSVQITRKLNLNILLLDQKYYPALRSFYQGMRTADEEQILLQPNAGTTAN
jgi:regulator of replication initiation timing